MNWKEKKHKWALEVDGRLFGSQRSHHDGLTGESGPDTMLFLTKKNAEWFVSTYGWDIKPRIVKVEIKYTET